MAIQGMIDKALFNFDRLQKPVRLHLKNVYAALAISMLAAAVGSYFHLFVFPLGGILTGLASLGWLVLIATTEVSWRTKKKRLFYMIAFAFFTGLGLGPLLDIVIRIDPSIIPSAFMATTVIFTCFSVAALTCSERKYLYMGGFLFSGLSWLLMAGLLNLFLRSQLLFQLELYLGLVIMCCFVLYDTQLIVEKFRRGDDDFIWHGVELFIDFINIFRRILILLANKENRKRRD